MAHPNQLDDVAQTRFREEGRLQVERVRECERERMAAGCDGSINLSIGVDRRVAGTYVAH